MRLIAENVVLRLINTILSAWPVANVNATSDTLGTLAGKNLAVHLVFNHVAEILQAEETVSDKHGLVRVPEGIVLLIKVGQLAILEVVVELVSHHE
jgi:hypothetical protein